MRYGEPHDRLEMSAAPLVNCPLCGADGGYTLGEGSTFRWWSVQCAGCGQELSECRSDSDTRLDAPKPARWAAADDAWNEAGAYAAKLAAEIERLRMAHPERWTFDWFYKRHDMDKADNRFYREPEAGHDRIGFVLKRHNGQGCSYDAVQKSWDAACDAAGVVDMHIHDMRGRAGVDSLLAGNIGDAQRLLGHSGEAMTRRYVEGKYARKAKPSK